MLAKPIPFTAGHASGLDELAGAGLLINAFVDEAETFRSRPGIGEWGDFPSSHSSTDPVIGLWAFGDHLIYVAESSDGTRNIYAWSGGNVLNLSAGNPTYQLEGTLLPKFAGRQILIINGRRRAAKIAGLSSARLGGSPPNFSDVVFCAQRVIGAANDDSGVMYWSEPGLTGTETYDTTVEFREAEARP